MSCCGISDTLCSVGAVAYVRPAPPEKPLCIPFEAFTKGQVMFLIYVCWLTVSNFQSVLQLMWTLVELAVYTAYLVLVPYSVLVYVHGTTTTTH